MLLFFLFSVFYVWLSVGGSGREKESEALERQDSWLEYAAENLGVYELMFLSVSPLKGKDKERLGLTQEYGGQMMR